MGKYLDIADKMEWPTPHTYGRVVEFHSPIWGRCYGRIKEITADIYLLTEHSVTKEEATIPIDWITRIIFDESVRSTKKTKNTN